MVEVKGVGAGLTHGVYRQPPVQARRRRSGHRPVSADRGGTGLGRAGSEFHRQEPPESIGEGTLLQRVGVLLSEYLHNFGSGIHDFAPGDFFGKIGISALQRIVEFAQFGYTLA